MRALCVGLVAAGVGAAMDSLVPLSLGGVIVDGVDQLVRDSKSRHNDVRERRVLLHRREKIRTGWGERVIMKRSGA